MKETLIILGALISFPLFFYLIIVLIANIGGWKSIAQKHPAKQFYGKPIKTLPLSSLQIGYFGQYSSVVNIKVYPEGVWLRPVLFFKFGHSPIFIKWNDIKTIEKTTIIFTEKLKVNLNKDSQIIFIKKSLTTELETLFKQNNHLL